MGKTKKSKKRLGKYLPNRKQFLGGIFVFALLGLTFAFAAVRAVEVPAPSDVSQAQATIIYYDDGVTELGRLGESNRVSLDITDIPKTTQEAILAAEDRAFYEHGGFSVRGIARALFSNTTSGTTSKSA